MNPTRDEQRSRIASALRTTSARAASMRPFSVSRHHISRAFRGTSTKRVKNVSKCFKLFVRQFGQIPFLNGPERVIGVAADPDRAQAGMLIGLRAVCCLAGAGKRILNHLIVGRFALFPFLVKDCHPVAHDPQLSGKRRLSFCIDRSAHFLLLAAFLWCAALGALWTA
jgi:hypothetical protein